MSTEIELSEKPRGTVIRLEPAFALADGKALEPTKADPVRVGRGMSIAQGFEIIVSSCLRHFQLNEPTVVKARNVEALHQARVAIRRLRSALALFRPIVADQEFDRVQRELRWLVAEFGDARNLDVYLEHDLSRDQRLFVEERRKDAYDRAIAAMATKTSNMSARSAASCRPLKCGLRSVSGKNPWLVAVAIGSCSTMRMAAAAAHSTGR